MKKMRLNPDKASTDIYVILRVYDLTGDIGLRILLDPATMERNGELVLEAESYTVMQQNPPDWETE